MNTSRRGFLYLTGTLSAAWAVDAKYVSAETTFGAVRGVDNDGVKTFKGIAYGANTGGKKCLFHGLSPWVDVRHIRDFAGGACVSVRPGSHARFRPLYGPFLRG